ncbi:MULTISPECIES: nuclear transport factor 2 family protein [Paraburkholderia]|uniref:Nuclear transport factor 2 family protein n=1 Tax=Paraburkholderia madseniana TaxID=2599607 RepID=A0AAP5BJR3_9BURK|nr:MULTISPECIES: nuclear transport factor 2 family protein [Paraburkholderia]MCX4149957.1 nuclear transport factor 2 family protein [Paraburkholderia madseniana]MDN7152893.1 nuclear transport factor 2 family protein [Paraburkholderia sp. WS6]MDQ6411775.1 nuclear transport factor 2 family protein [Paraburkholderia madseniana]
MTAFVSEVDKLACAQLISTYAWYVDQTRYEELVELFTEDGILCRPDVEVAGRAAILELMKRRSPQVICRHMCSTQVISLTSSDVAEAITYFAYYQSESSDEAVPGLDGPVAIGEYHDRLHRIERDWRFAERRVVLAMMKK